MFKRNLAKTIIHYAVIAIKNLTVEQQHGNYYIDMHENPLISSYLSRSLSNNADVSVL